MFHRAPVLRAAVCFFVALLFHHGSVVSNNVKNFGSARVWFPDIKLIDSSDPFGSRWPAQAGIKLVENIKQQPMRATAFPRRIVPVRRTYEWQGEQLIISFNMTAISNPTCTRLVPPVTWLSSSRSRVKVSHSGLLTKPTKFAIDVTDYATSSLVPPSSSSSSSYGKKDEDDEVSSSSIQVSVPRTSAESSLSTLRMNGFLRQDIYRMLDKGPWVLAFDISSTLPRLFRGLMGDLGLTQAQAVHIVSHCPYLIAQYAHYQGRDVVTTFRALLDAGYTRERLMEDIMRFPSMLSSPPERISGWCQLLQCFNVATSDKALFGKMLRRAPFMYYHNPPQIFDDVPSDEIVTSDVSTTATGFVAYSSLRVLKLLQEQGFPDLDKIVRTQPSILLANAAEVTARANFLFNLFMETSPLPDGDDAMYGAASDGGSSSSSSSGSGRGGYRKQPKTRARHGARSLPVALKASATNGTDTLVPMKDLRSTDAVASLTGMSGLSEAEQQAAKKQHAREQLGSLLLTYPALLSIDHQQMRAAGNALRAAGMRRWEVLQLARRHPPVLGRDPVALVNLVSFLRFHCGMKKADLLAFLNRYPAVLAADVEDIEPKVNYLFQSLGGTQQMLRRYPAFLSFDLDTHTRPRAEFLRALSIDPLINGVGFLVAAPAREIAQLAGVGVELFEQFQTAFIEHQRRDKDIISESSSSARPLAFKYFWQVADLPTMESSPEDALFAEFDFDF